MKKVFTLIDPKKKPARMVEAAKSTINKYIKRERAKKLPEGVDFCDFRCEFGLSAEDAKPVHLSKLNAEIDAAEKASAESFYVEVSAIAGYRNKK